MADPISFDELGMEVVADLAEGRAKPAPGTPFKIALLGDFSGRASRGLLDPSAAGKRPTQVDRDTIDELIKKLRVEVHLSLEEEGESLVIRFAELDDFHPDRLYQRLDIFQPLRKLRKALRDPKTFDAAAEIARSMFAPQATPKPDAQQKSPPPQKQQGGSLLDQVIAETTGQPVEQQPLSAEKNELSSFLGQIVGPHLVKELSGQEELTYAVDQAVSEVMRAILHHPEFQELEATWRSVDFLIRRLNTGEDLSIHLFDISRDEFKQDLSSSNDPRKTALYRSFVEHATEQFGGTPFAALIGLYEFGPAVPDIALLGRMATIAGLAGAPFITGARDSFLGTPSLAATPDPSSWQKLPDEEAMLWRALRHSPQACWLGLCLPRFLLRLPFGEKTDPTETFDFEEFPGLPQHQSYLWANSAIACALLLGKSYTAEGWEMRAALQQDMENLPLHIYTDKGETDITPCAEVVFTERAASHIMELGFMPLLSFINQDRARLGRFQSVSAGSSRLDGRWS
ncbi:MAG: type VI secretion system contractile sheath large subunit [Pseudomonadota bacterium]